MKDCARDKMRALLRKVRNIYGIELEEFSETEDRIIKEYESYFENKTTARCPNCKSLLEFGTDGGHTYFCKNCNLDVSYSDAILNLETLSAEESELIKDFRNGMRFVGFDENDFIERAVSGGEPWKYSQSKFLPAIKKMIEDYDMDSGVTKDTIDWYLEEYCIDDNFDRIYIYRVPEICAMYLLGGDVSDSMTEEELKAVQKIEEDNEHFGYILNQSEPYFSATNDVSTSIFKACNVVDIKCYRKLLPYEITENELIVTANSQSKINHFIKNNSLNCEFDGKFYHGRLPLMCGYKTYFGGDMKFHFSKDLDIKELDLRI